MKVQGGEPMYMGKCLICLRKCFSSIIGNLEKCPVCGSRELEISPAGKEEHDDDDTRSVRG